VTIKIVVADDQALVRGGFSVLLDSAPDIEVVGEAGDGAEAVDVVLRERPDVVLMDIRMPVFDGIEATRRIVADPRTSSTKVLIVTTFDLDEYVYDGLRAGASGFLLKDTRPELLLDAVRVVADGEALLAPQITRRLIEEFTTRPTPSVPAAELDVLTDREQDARLPTVDEARRPRPRAVGDARVRSRAGHTGRCLTKSGPSRFAPTGIVTIQSQS
jgi:DNA-binding NarL/FixJ family response regulator